MHLGQSACGGNETFPHFEHYEVTNLPLFSDSQNSRVFEMGMSNRSVMVLLE